MDPRALVAASLFLVAGCGGGAAAGPRAAEAVLVPPPTAAPVSTTTSASLTITVPRNTSSAQRSPHYVSPNSTSIAITVVSVNGIAPTIAQAPVNPTIVALSTAGGGNCTVSPAGETCTVPLPAPTGAVQYTFQLKDSTGNVLARNTVTFTIAATSSQSFAAVLAGVVASVSVFKPTLQTGTAFSGPITVQGFDPSGALIVGGAPYANAFTLTDNDTTSHTSLTVNAVTGKTVTVTSPNDVVILNYDGASEPPFTITATIPPG